MEMNASRRKRNITTKRDKIQRIAGEPGVEVFRARRKSSMARIVKHASRKKALNEDLCIAPQPSQTTDVRESGTIHPAEPSEIYSSEVNRSRKINFSADVMSIPPTNMIRRRPATSCQ